MRPAVPEPPKRTVRPRVESKAMALAKRGAGPKLARCVQRSLLKCAPDCSGVRPAWELPSVYDLRKNAATAATGTHL
jgi:hypothetical protein